MEGYRYVLLLTADYHAGLLATGHAICEDQQCGVLVPDETARFQAMYYEAKPQGVAAMVNAFQGTYPVLRCPDKPSGAWVGFAST
jgi:hypothetical protein